MNLLRSDQMLGVRDLDLSAKWFVDVLGCDKTGPDPANWALHGGECDLHARALPGCNLSSELGDHSYVAYLTVDAVDGYYSRALAEKADVLKPLTGELWGRREMHLRTPVGHRIMLSERM